MGKLGGRELNVSSDIDLIFAYPDDGDTGGAKVISNFEFFERLGKRIIQALAEITEHGQVFRVDMRLRPHGDSGPLVCSFDMLENYFITQGREWERYAWIKARVIQGKRFTELEKIARPFIFRKYLDFGSINAMRVLHSQIRREVTRKDRALNVKLGPGGIREIEFIAQVFQLIRGGRDRDLQIKPTLKVLDALVHQGSLAPAAVDELKAAYDFLRRLEHRLQYLDDAQTHDLPTTDEDQAIIARAMGFENYAALLVDFDAHRANVSQYFDAVFSDPGKEGHALDSIWEDADDAEAIVPTLQELGYADPERAARHLANLKRGGRYQHLPNNIRSRFDALIPRLVDVAANHTSPNETLSRCLDFIDVIGGRGAYLAMLQQYPEALKKVGDLVSASRWAAQYLSRHPILLDELLDPRILSTAPDWTTFREDLQRRLEEVDPDTERQMDIMREQHHTQVFRLLAQDLANVLSVEQLADHLSALADLLLDLTIPLCWRKLRKRQLWKARRQGTGLRLRPGYRLPVQRFRPGRCGVLRPARPAHQQLAVEPDRRRHIIRNRPAPSSQRRCRPAGEHSRRVSQIPTRIGMDLGTPGAYARALFRRRHRCRRRLRGDPGRGASPTSRHQRAA